jgi:hypothetical protein
MPDIGRVLALPGAHLHDYGKQARSGRKLGHATLRADSRQDLQAGLDHLLALIQPLAAPSTDSGCRGEEQGTPSKVPASSMIWPTWSRSLS